MDAAEFDTHADGYLAAHAHNIRISGENPDYFAGYKIHEVRRRWAALKRIEPNAVLDFGAGIGNSWPYLSTAFPTARLTGLDVSERSLDLAERRFPGVVEAVCYDGDVIPLREQTFDIIFSACVFHHIDANQHVSLFLQLRRLLRPGGVMAIFEHNPINPVTRHIIATCPFDEHAVLIPARELKRRQMEAGFQRVEVTYTAFFPGALAALRPLERYMTGLPLGAQYYTWATG